MIKGLFCLTSLLYRSLELGISTITLPWLTDLVANETQASQYTKGLAHLILDPGSPPTKA